MKSVRIVGEPNTSSVIARGSHPDGRRRARRLPGGRAQGAGRDTSASRLAVPHHRGNVGGRRIRQHPGRERDALAPVGDGNREGLGEFPRAPGVPLGRQGHVQGRRHAGWARCSPAAPWARPSRCWTTRRCASCCPRSRISTRCAPTSRAATCARWRCAPRAISPRARFRSSRPRPRSSEWSRAQRHGERVPLSLDYLMASLGIPFLFPPICLHGEYFGDGAMRQTAPLSPAIHLGADRLLVIGVRPTQLDSDSAFRRAGFAADARPAVRLHAGHAVQRPDLRRPREPGAHQPALGACRRRPSARGRSAR